MVDVAQLVRASDCGSESRGFKSPHPPCFAWRPLVDAPTVFFTAPGNNQHLVLSNQSWRFSTWEIKIRDIAGTDIATIFQVSINKSGAMRKASHYKPFDCVMPRMDRTSCCRKRYLLVTSCMRVFAAIRWVGHCGLPSSALRGWLAVPPMGIMLLALFLVGILG